MRGAKVEDKKVAVKTNSTRFRWPCNGNPGITTTLVGDQRGCFMQHRILHLLGETPSINPPG